MKSCPAQWSIQWKVMLQQQQQKKAVIIYFRSCWRNLRNLIPPIFGLFRSRRYINKSFPSQYGEGVNSSWCWLSRNWNLTADFGFFKKGLSYWWNISPWVKHGINFRFDTSYILLFGDISILFKLKQIVNVNIIHPLNRANKLKIAV